MIEILTVNYNTPELIKQLIESRNVFYPKIQLRIIDGSENKNQLLFLVKQYDNIILTQLGYNIHHGRGLHKGLMESKADYVLILDSDTVFIKEGGVDYLFSLLGNNYMVAKNCLVDKDGYNKRDGKCYKYPHPSICLIDRKKYVQSKYHFIHHGAPAINIAIGMDIEARSNELINATEVDTYFKTQGRGTVSKFGYGYYTYGKRNTDKTILDGV